MIHLRSIPTLLIAVAVLAAAAWAASVSSQQSGIYAHQAQPPAHVQHHARAATY